MALRGPSEELYDIDADPHEIHNLAHSVQAEHRKALLRLRTALDVWMSRRTTPARRAEPPEVVAQFKRIWTSISARRPGISPERPGKRRGKSLDQQNIVLELNEKVLHIKTYMDNSAPVSHTAFLRS